VATDGGGMRLWRCSTLLFMLLNSLSSASSSSSSNDDKSGGQNPQHSLQRRNDQLVAGLLLCEATSVHAGDV